MLQMVHWRFAFDNKQLASLKICGSKRKRVDQDGAQNMATKFLELATAAQRSHPEDPVCIARYAKMVTNVKHFMHTSQALVPTSWLKKALPVKGMVLLDPANALVREQFRVLASAAQVQIASPFTRFAKSVSKFYGKYEADRLVSAIVLTVAKLNNVPGSLAVCVDYAVSIDKHHAMSQAVKSIKEHLHKGKTPCAVFAQVAVNSESAFSFWSGALSQTRRASVLVSFFHIFDRGFYISPDVADFAEFYRC
jgi:hypothetical protein